MHIYHIFYECKFMSEGAWILLPLVLQKRIFAKLPKGGLSPPLETPRPLRKVYKAPKNTLSGTKRCASMPAI